MCTGVYIFSQYQWVDEKGKKCKCTAPQYVEYVMAFIKKTIHDESVFPTKYGMLLLLRTCTLGVGILSNVRQFI